MWKSKRNCLKITFMESISAYSKVSCCIYKSLVHRTPLAGTAGLSVLLQLLHQGKTKELTACSSQTASPL
jgi:hypothetical protein